MLTWLCIRPEGNKGVEMVSDCDNFDDSDDQ